MEHYKVEVATQNAMDHEPPPDIGDNGREVRTKAEKHAKVAVERQMDQEPPSVEKNLNSAAELHDMDGFWRTTIPIRSSIMEMESNGNCFF